MRARRLVIPTIVVLVACAALLYWSSWNREPDGLSRRTVSFGDRAVTMLVMRLPTSLRDYALVADPAHPKTVREWRESLGAEIAFNGSYFNEDGSPSGYWKTGKGKSVVPWPSPEERRDPHGYTFALSAVVGQLSLRYLPDEPVAESDDETFLSFPTLVANGDPMVGTDSGQRARRTAVADTADNGQYLIVTESGTLSLYELAQWLSTQPEGFVLAGNLDGGPSTGVSIENGEHDVDVSSSVVPNVIVIFDRSRD